MKLIDKAAVVAEIRKYIKSAEAFLKYHHNKKDRLCYSYEHQRLTMCELLSFLDTLDVKEVDLSLIEPHIKEEWNKINTGHTYSIIDSYNIFVGICTYFYELGLKASEGMYNN